MCCFFDSRYNLYIIMQNPPSISLCFTGQIGVTFGTWPLSVQLRGSVKQGLVKWNQWHFRGGTETHPGYNCCCNWGKKQDRKEVRPVWKHLNIIGTILVYKAKNLSMVL